MIAGRAVQHLVVEEHVMAGHITAIDTGTAPQEFLQSAWRGVIEIDCGQVFHLLVLVMQGLLLPRPVQLPEPQRRQRRHE